MTRPNLPAPTYLTCMDALNHITTQANGARYGAEKHRYTDATMLASLFQDLAAVCQTAQQIIDHDLRPDSLRKMIGGGT